MEIRIIIDRTSSPKNNFVQIENKKGSTAILLFSLCASLHFCVLDLSLFSRLHFYELGLDKEPSKIADFGNLSLLRYFNF